MKNERYLSHTDAQLIANLSEYLLRIAGPGTQAGEELLDLLTIATVVPRAEMPRCTIKVGSTVIYSDVITHERHRVTVVMPDASRPAEGLIALTSPLAIALIGHSEGDLVNLNLPYGRRQTLCIDEVLHMDGLPRLKSEDMV